MKDGIIEDLKSKSAIQLIAMLLCAAFVVGGMWVLTSFVICIGGGR